MVLKGFFQQYFSYNKRENSSKISYNSNEIKWLLNWKIEKKEVFSIFQILTQSTFLVCHSFSTLDCNRKNCIKLSSFYFIWIVTNFWRVLSLVFKIFFFQCFQHKKIFLNEWSSVQKVFFSSFFNIEVFSIFQILTQSTFLVCHSFSTLDCNRKNCIKLSCNTCNTFNLKIKEHTFWQKKITSTKMKI
jgi:hypothetical protein